MKLRVYAKTFSDEEVTEAIRKVQEMDNDDIIGIRIDKAGLPIGYTFPPSRRWEDGDPTNDILDGTSCLRINKLDRDYGGYNGNQIYAVSGRSLYEGEDPGELIIEDATIVALL
jgi:hypothetical protein